MTENKTVKPKHGKSPLPNNPWDVCTKLPVGDREEATIYTAVGAALTVWEMMESSLGALFTLMIDAEGEGAGQAYGQISSFIGRSDLLTAAFSCYAHRNSAAFCEFPKFIALVRNYAARRNEIAHGMVLNPDLHSIKTQHTFYLCPAYYAARKRLTFGERFEKARELNLNALLALTVPGEKYAYTAAQVDYYRTEFLRLAITATRFEREARALKEKPTTPGSPVGLLGDVSRIAPPGSQSGSSERK